jgi:hypothetical protein
VELAEFRWRVCRRLYALGARLFAVDRDRHTCSLQRSTKDLGRPFALADHQAVTGIDFDERLNTADRFNLCTTECRVTLTRPLISAP